MKKSKNNNRLRVDYKQLIKFIKYLGFVEQRQKRSDHIIYKNKSNKTVPIPFMRGTVPQGLLITILKQTDSTRQDLIDFLNS